MTKRLLRHKLFFLTPVLLWLGGCATAPGPYGGAPVVDRSIRQAPPLPATSLPSAAQAQTSPLARSDPLQPQERLKPAAPDVPYAAPGHVPPAAAPADAPNSAYATPEQVPPVSTIQPPAQVPPATPPRPPVRVPAVTPTLPAQVNTPPAPPPTLPPAELSRQGNQSVAALLNSASQYVNAGELDKAAASLERALRIEPRNARIWHDLAQIRLHQHQYQQAESLASKSNSLSGGDNPLHARNWRLISVARRAQGNSAGADEAEAQAVVQER